LAAAEVQHLSPTAIFMGDEVAALQLAKAAVAVVVERQ